MCFLSGYVSSKQTVRKVTTWVKENCSGSIGFPSGVSVTCRFNGRKRDLDSKTKESLDKACEPIKDNPFVLNERFSLALVKDIFEEVDGKDNPGE